MWARPAVQKGANVPEPYKMKELLADKEAMEKHAEKVRNQRPNPSISANKSRVVLGYSKA